MDRRRFLLTSLAGALAVPRAAEAQRPGKTHKVGALSVPSWGLIPFEEALRDLGYIRDRSVMVEQRSGGTGEIEQHREAANELVRLNVEVIVTGPSSFIDAAQLATRTIPIVMAYGSDPVGRGYIASFARPGGNITGLTWDPAPTIFGKYVELAADLVPRLSRIAGIVDPRWPYRPYWNEAKIEAQRRGLTLDRVEVTNSSDIPMAFESVIAQHVQALLVSGGPWLFAYQRQISELARVHRLPTVWMYREGPEAGGLISYGPNLRDSWRQVARYVDKIFRGAKPGDVPVEQPTKFELVINLKTAKALGLTIPPSLLARADQVLE